MVATSRGSRLIRRKKSKYYTDVFSAAALDDMLRYNAFDIALVVGGRVGVVVWWQMWWCGCRCGGGGRRGL